MEYVLAIVALLMIVGFIIYVLYDKYGEHYKILDEEEAAKLDKQREYEKIKYRKAHPMIYANVAQDYRFASRIKKVLEKIQSFENIDYVGAKDVIEKIRQHLFVIIQRLTDDKYNAFVKANPSELDRSLTILNERLKPIEDACNKLAHAITIQELDPHRGSKEIKSIVNEAEEILAKQLNEEEMSAKYMENAAEILEREAELMRKVDQMQQEEYNPYRTEQV